jgi:hypothetical protein
VRMQSSSVTLVVHKQVRGRTRALSWVFSSEIEALSVAKAIRDETWLIVRGGFATAHEATEAANRGGLIRRHTANTDDLQNLDDSSVFTRDSVRPA